MNRKALRKAVVSAALTMASAVAFTVILKTVYRLFGPACTDILVLVCLFLLMVACFYVLFKDER